MIGRAHRLRGVVVVVSVIALVLASCASGPQRREPSASVWSGPRSAAAISDPELRAARLERVAELFELGEVAQHPCQEGDAGAHADRLEKTTFMVTAFARANLIVESTMASLDDELGEVLEVRADVRESDDRVSTAWNIAAITIGGALGLVATAMQFGDRTSEPGDVIAIAGGAATTGLGLMALFATSGDRLPSAVHFNALAPFFGRTSARDPIPPVVMRYLETTLPGERAAHVEELRASWIAEGRISVDGTPDANARIDLLASPLHVGAEVPDDVLTDRAAMLKDVRDRVSLIDADLSSIAQRAGECER
jgi:hypothetical protein